MARTQLALLGFGHFALARQLVAALSSVSLPRHEIGAETARSLLQSIKRGEPARGTSLSWTLVARGSTAGQR